jgi:preprotein translocase subunit SecE
VARDRKRAKQRRARRGRDDASTPSPGRAPGSPRVGESPADGGEPPAGPTPVRADVPGALDHASSDVDEFDAALVRGAGGVPAQDPEHLSEREIEDEAEAEDDLTEDEIQEIASSSGAGGNGGLATPEQASGAPQRGGNRVVGFIRASWAELQRVQWPDRRQVFQATAVVLGFVAIAGAYLGLADYVAKEIVEFIL